MELIRAFVRAATRRRRPDRPGRHRPAPGSRDAGRVTDTGPHLVVPASERMPWRPQQRRRTTQ